MKKPSTSHIKMIKSRTEKIIENRLFTIYGVRRKRWNEFTEFADALNNLKSEILYALKIDRMIEWLNNKLQKQDLEEINELRAQNTQQSIADTLERRKNDKRTN